MSTPNPIFPPLTKGFSWKPSTTDSSGNPLPNGETEASTTVGIRPDGNASFSNGNYQRTIIILGAVNEETLDAFNTALGAALPPGNYWGNLQQTDTLNGQNATSDWMATEFTFSIPQPVVKPAPPSNPTVS